MAQPAAHTGGAARGREAGRPTEIPRGGWKDIALRAKDETSKDNVSIIAAGVAFFVLLAIFPALAAMVSIYGLVADPADVERQMTAMSGVLPQEAQQIIADQLNRVASASGGALGLSAVISILLALWSASSGMKTLMTSLNITYDEEEKRGFIRFNAVALALTIGLILFMLIALSLVAVLPALLGFLGLPDWAAWLVTILKWPLLMLAVLFVLAVLYRYAPSRDAPRWQWVSPGAIAATVLWIVGSIAFSVYVSNFGSYNETYGSLGAVVVLMMWLYLSAFVVLLGAELNAETERQTRRDTTEGEPRRMGSRGAYAADTLGPSHRRR